MDEFTLIRDYFARAMLGPDVVVGIGDDCAVVNPPEGKQLVMSIDTMVEGVHFAKGTLPDRIAIRAMSAALSDLAAMGAQPLWFTLALSLPEANADWLAGFSEGLFSVANRYDCSLIGGDTTRGPLTITIQVHGAVAKDKALRRAGARPDDILYVTGDLGDAAAALAVLQKKLTVSPGVSAYLMKRFWAPTPRLREGEILVDVASAAIDVSDGLYADAAKICEASGVGAMIDVARLPISKHWRDYTSEGQRFAWALGGGEDYQLCFTVPKEQVAKMEAWVREGKITATAIGKLTKKLDVILLKDGKPYDVELKGYNHFAPS